MAQLAVYNQVIERLVDPAQRNAVIDNFRLAVAAGRQGMQLVRALRQAGITVAQGWDIVNGVDQQLRQHQRQWSEMANSLAHELGNTIQQGWNEHMREQAGGTGQDWDNIMTWSQNNPSTTGAVVQPNGGRTPVNSVRS